MPRRSIDLLNLIINGLMQQGMLKRAPEMQKTIQVSTLKACRGSLRVINPAPSTRKPLFLAKTRSKYHSTVTRASYDKQDSGEPSTSGRDAATSSTGRPTPPPSTDSEPRFPFAPITALATLGLAETAYLTATKLTGATVACPLSGGCASVLTSDFASLWGMIPLSAAGMLAYGGVATLAFMGARAAQRNAIDAAAALRTAVLAGGLLLGTTSAYLMYILVTAFPGELCPWCLSSAALSGGIVALAASGLPRRELEDAAAPGAGLAAATLLALSLGLGTVDASQAGTGITELEFRQPAIVTESPKDAATLARRLKDAGAKMYGAFWCSHCYEQKQAFGRDAMAEFPYVECFPEGWKQGIEMAPVCKEAGLEGFPTWVIGGEKLEGDQPLEVLQAALDKSAASDAR